MFLFFFNIQHESNALYRLSTYFLQSLAMNSNILNFPASPIMHSRQNHRDNASNKM